MVSLASCRFWQMCDDAFEDFQRSRCQSEPGCFLLPSQFIIGHWGIIGFYEEQSKGGSSFFTGGKLWRSVFGLTNVLTKITLFLKTLWGQ